MSFWLTKRFLNLFVAAVCTSLVSVPCLQAQDLADPSSIVFDSMNKPAAKTVEPVNEKPASTAPKVVAPKVMLPMDQPPKTDPAPLTPVVANMPASVRTSIPAPGSQSLKKPANSQKKTASPVDQDGASVLPVINVVYPESINLNVPAGIRIVASSGNAPQSSPALLTVGLPAHLELVQSTPEPVSVAGASASYNLPALSTGKPLEIFLQVIAREKKPVSVQTRLEIVSESQIQLEVRQPVLELSLAGNQQGVLGQPSQMELIVRNTGDGNADQLNIELNLPEGCVADKGALEKLLSAGSLAPGEEARFQVSTRMVSDGAKTVTAVARALGADSGARELGMNVVRPELELAVSAPEITWVNSRAWFSFTVANTSPIDIDQAVVLLHVPTLTVQTISTEADYDDQAKTLKWKIGSIAAGETATFQMVAIAPDSGLHMLTASLESSLTEPKEIAIDTTARARANLAVSVVQLENPAPVGVTSQYVVVVENRGTEAANMIDVRVDLPAEWTAEGSDACKLANGSANFGIDSMAVGERKEIRFLATCTIAGESLLRAVARHDETQYTASSENSMLLFQADARRVAETAEPRLNR